MSERSYDAANERLIAREERKLDRKREKLEATERSMKKTLASAIAVNKAKLAKEGLDYTDRNSESTNAIMRQADSPDGARVGYNDGEVITGREDRVWESE